MNLSSNVPWSWTASSWIALEIKFSAICHGNVSADCVKQEMAAFSLAMASRLTNFLSICQTTVGNNLKWSACSVTQMVLTVVESLFFLSLYMMFLLREDNSQSVTKVGISRIRATLWMRFALLPGLHVILRPKTEIWYANQSWKTSSASAIFHEL